jgi:hypothetical protein
VLSIGSTGSALSIGSIGSFASVLSIGSFVCVGSVLSAVSAWSIMSWRSKKAVGRSQGAPPLDWRTYDWRARTRA